MKIRREEHMAGGNGHVIIKEILDAEQLNGKCGLYAQVTLEPGCSLGWESRFPRHLCFRDFCLQGCILSLIYSVRRIMNT